MTFHRQTGEERGKGMAIRKIASLAVIAALGLAWPPACAGESSFGESAPAAGESTVMGNPDLDYAQVIFVRADRSKGGAWCFDTTVRHNDEGWDHYADAWQVLGPDGTILAERVLTHPHDDEQPFTRSKCSISIPGEAGAVTVRARCTVHGFGGIEVVVDLTAAEGERFKVTRK